MRWISTVGNYDYILTGSSMKTALHWHRCRCYGHRSGERC
ncbi:hypothetical protein O5541_02670 [Escherichia coli]|nr:hypothetical protein [Escherichia coli]